MITVHYSHRLPADYEVERILARTAERGPLWDAAPNLYFKAFLLRENGHFGATAHDFSSLYLWRQDQDFGEWLVRGGYKIVTDMFGRAEIETRFVLDARKGPGREARFAYKASLDIPLGADLTAAFGGEIEHNRRVAEQRDTIATVVGLDVQSWTFTRILLSENEPNTEHAGVAYQVIYLAQPLLETLPSADT